MRDDERIEEILREAWTPAMPDRMRDRVLLRARAGLDGQADSKKHPIRRRWRLWLVGVAVGTVLAANMIASARSTQMMAMMNGVEAEETSISIPMILKQNREAQRLMALSVESNSVSRSNEESHDIIRSF